MGVQSRTPGAGLVPRQRRDMILALLFLVLAVFGPWVGARAGQWPAPLDYHATIINGQVVGSGFLIDEGVVVTNAHVLRGRDPGDYVTLVSSGPGRARTEARIVAISSRIDLGVLAIPGGVMPRVSPMNAPVAVGLRVTSAGLDASGHGVPRPSAATGVVTEPALSVPAFGPGFVVDMPGARPGFSGGPMLDGRGRLVGMVSAIRSGGPMRLSSGGARVDAESFGGVEAFALDAQSIRSEVRRLLGEGG